MKQKELKKLTRYQLLELLVMQTERADGLQKQVEELQEKLEDRELHFSRMGSIAEASVYISGVFEASQQAADLYLDSAKKRGDELLAQAQQQHDAIMEEARIQAEQLLTQAQEAIRIASAAEQTKCQQQAEKRNANGTGKQKKARKKRTSKNRRAKK